MALPFVPLPFGIKVEVAWETGSGVAVCIHFVKKTAAVAVTPGDLTWANDSFDTWRTGLRFLQPPGVIIEGIRATDWSSATGATQLNVPSANVAGTNATPQLPLNAAIRVSFATALRGRSYRGGPYLPALGENVISVGDIIGAGMRNSIVSQYNTLKTDLNAGGLVLVVFSQFLNGVRRITGVGTPVTAISVDQYSDSQRRRLAGRGA